MNNATRRAFRLRTMSYRHFRNASQAYHRAIDDGTLVAARSERNASDVAFFYHESLALPLA